MRIERRAFLALALIGVGASVSGCSKSPSSPDATGATVLRSVAPQAGATNVSLGTSVEVKFNHPLMAGMEQYVDVHKDDVAGPEVDGDCIMSSDSTMLTFMFADSLEPNTTYVIHVGGGMMDDDGQDVDLGQYGMGMGGAWVTAGMMGDSTGMGPGMMGGDSLPEGHMGSGWEDTQNGTWGMQFVFTTGG